MWDGLPRSRLGADEDAKRSNQAVLEKRVLQLERENRELIALLQVLACLA
jgi:hypothetical protein